MIIKSALVSSHDSEVFLERMSVAINTFQTEGLKVDIQYQPLYISSTRPAVLYSALIHGLKENTNDTILLP